jgi:hypothetical protein
MDLSEWSKAELIAKIQLLQFELEQLKKAITGPRSERLVVINPDQSSLFSEEKIETQPNPEEVETAVKVKKNRKGKQPKRQNMPTHLPVEEIILERIPVSVFMK